MSGTCPTCGANTKAPRSIDQHRRFFGLMKAAFHHWPENHERQFADETELRKFITMKAGHREIGARIPLTGIRKEVAVTLVEAGIRASGTYATTAIHGSDLIVWKPKSINFKTLGHLPFCALNTAVDEILKAEIGLSGDELLREHEAAA